jgi:hypothetical protein
LSSRELKEEFLAKLLDEDAATFHFCLQLPRLRPLNQILYEKIDQLISSGIARRFEEEQFDYGQEPAKYKDQEVN